jgi:4-nitrophenyl phosphatase
MLPEIKALLIDLDGVIYRGDEAIPGAPEAIVALAPLGIKHVFVTNNATLRPDQFAEKLNRLGIPSTPADVVTSSQATAEYLRGIAPDDATVFVVGEEGLREALTSRGFQLTDGQATYVVVGLDRYVTYERLFRAGLAIQRGAQLIATNADRFLPVEEGRAPGAGAIVAALVTTTDAQPVIVGKPEPTLLHVAMARIGVSPETTAMVGDQIESDIRAGKAAGIATIHIAGDTPTHDGDITPDLRVRDMTELVNVLKGPEPKR